MPTLVSGRAGVRAWVWSISKPEKVCWQTRALTPLCVSGCRSIPTRDVLSPVLLPPRALWAGWASEDRIPSVWEGFSRLVRAGALLRVLWPRRECGQNRLWLKSQGRWSLADNCSSGQTAKWRAAPHPCTSATWGCQQGCPGLGCECDSDWGSMRRKLAHGRVAQGRHLSLSVPTTARRPCHPLPRAEDLCSPHFGEGADAREASLVGADGYCTFVLSLALF